MYVCVYIESFLMEQSEIDGVWSETDLFLPTIGFKHTLLNLPSLHFVISWKKEFSFSVIF